MTTKIHDLPPYSEEMYDLALAANTELDYLEGQLQVVPFYESPNYPMDPGRRAANAAALTRFRHLVTDSFMNAYFMGKSNTSTTTNEGDK